MGHHNHKALRSTERQPPRWGPTQQGPHFSSEANSEIPSVPQAQQQGFQQAPEISLPWSPEALPGPFPAPRIISAPQLTGPLCAALFKLSHSPRCRPSLSQLPLPQVLCRPGPACPPPGPGRKLPGGTLFSQLLRKGSRAKAGRWTLGLCLADQPRPLGAWAASPKASLASWQSQSEAGLYGKADVASLEGCAQSPRLQSLQVCLSPSEGDWDSGKGKQMRGKKKLGKRRRKKLAHSSHKGRRVCENEQAGCSPAVTPGESCESEQPY